MTGKIPHKDWKFIGKTSTGIAKSLGLDPEDIKIAYDKDEELARITVVEDKAYISLNPSLSKKNMEAFLRHEIAHRKEGVLSKEEYEENPNFYVYHELKALLAERYYSPYDIGDIMIVLVDRYEIPKGEAAAIVSREAQDLGISKRFTKRSRDLFWDYMKKGRPRD